MSSINKLQISGIRSFKPDKESTIKFFHPFTLIIGPNGSGKTTIIESLLAATTGEFPANCPKKKGFLHDHKLYESATVPAKAKLQFEGVNNHTYTCLRNWKSEHKRDNAEPSLSSVGSSLKDETDDKSIDTRCAEMDDLIPSLLGVSKAILTNVIFCHQEDSTWPFQDSTVVKKKFDAIFESDKYTKAIDEFKKEKKKLNDNALEYQNQYIAAREIFNTVIDIKSEIKKDEDIISKEEDDLRIKENLLSEKTKKYDEMIEIFESYNKAIVDTGKLEGELKSCLQNIEEKKNDITNLYTKESDLELKKLLESQESLKLQLQKGIDKKQKEYENYKNELNKKTNEFNDNEKNIAIIKQKIYNINERKEELEKKIKSVCEKCNIKYESNKMNEIISKLENEIKKKKNDIQNEVKSIEKEANSQKEGVVKERIRIEQLKQNSNNLIKPIQNNIDTLEKENKKMKNDIVNCEKAIKVADLNKINQQIEECQEYINKTCNIEELENNSKRYENEIQQLNKTIKEMEIKKKDFDKFQTLNTKIDFIDDNLKKKQSQLSELLEKNKSKFEELDIPTYSVDAIVNEFKTVYSTIETELNNVNSKINQLKIDKRDVDVKYQRVENDLVNKKNENDGILDDLKRLFKQNMSDNDIDRYYEVMNEMRQNIKKINSDIDVYRNMRKVLQGQMKKGAANKCCPLCERLMNDEELNKFKKSVEAKIQDPRIDEKIQQHQQKLKEIEEAVEKLDNNYDSFRKLKDVQNEIPNLEEREKELKEKVKEFQQKLEEMNNQQSDIKKKYSNIQSLKTISETLSQSIKEIENLQHEKSKCKSEFKLKGVNTDEIESLNEKLQNSIDRRNELTQKKMSALESMNDVNTKIQQYTKKMNRCKETKDLIVENTKKKNEYEMKIKENKEKIDKYVEEIKKYENENKNVDENYMKIKQKENELNQIWNKKIEEVKLKERENDKIYYHFKDISSTSQSYDTKTLNIELDQLIENSAKISQKKKEISDNINTCGNQLKCLDENLSSFNDEFVQIKKNLLYRECLHKADDIRSKINKINESLPKSISVDNYSEQIQNMRNEIDEIQKIVSEKRGSITAIQRKIDENNKKLNDSRYKNIEDKLCDYLIKKDTCRMAIEDVEITMKTINDALIEYHTRKIIEINERISELWKQTYSGEDIDTIRIVAEATNASGRSTKNYNYHIEMEKCGTTMPMRGRCSAGQKMLGSIVIRLALAEAFSLECGVMVLDEPTTSLDYANKQAVAQALIDLVKTRREQSNFQLICITHDDEFGRTLLRDPNVGRMTDGKYYRICREAVPDRPEYFISSIVSQTDDSY